MKVAKLFVIGILAFPLVLTLPTPLQKIDATLPECEITKNSLFCDFKESDWNNGYLEPVNEAIDKIYINNLRNLQLSSAICTNIALVNVSNVNLKDEEELSCEQGFDLAAKDTIFDRMPVPVNKIYLENCNVSSLVAGATLTKLTVIQSFISCLNISDPLTNNTSFTFKESSIGVLQSLVIDGWPEFIMKDTTILYIPPEGLIVKHGVLSMKGSSFINATKDSIIIYPNATLDLENYSGNLKFSNMLIPTNKQVFSGAEESETDFFYPFVICLFLLIAIVLVCLIILSIWYYKKKGKLCNQHVSKDPSDAMEVENEESRKLIEDESLTCHVISDLCGGDVGVKKQKNTTQTSVNVTSEKRQQSKSNTIVNKDRNKSFETEVDSKVNESKANEMSSKIKEDTISPSKRKSITNENQFSKEGKNRKEKASHPDSSDTHNLKNTNDSPITTVPGSIKRTVEDAKSGDDEDKEMDQNLSPANPPAPKDMLPEPEDMITDNVILFSFYFLNQKDKSDIRSAISNHRLKVGLKKNTYKWSEVNNEMLSRNPSLSSLQVIELKNGIDFGSIRNGDHLSKMNKTIIKTIKESNKTGASSLPPGQEGTKVYGDEVRTNPGKEHITQEVGNISTSEQTEQFEKKKNGSNGSNTGRGVAKGSNSLSENSSERNKGTEEDMISGPNQNKSMFNVDQQDNASLKNENGALYVAEARDVKEDIPKTHTTNMSLDYNETGSGDRQDKLNQENPVQGSPESNPLPKTDMITEPEDTITDNVVLLKYLSLREEVLEDVESVFKCGYVKAVLKKRKYEWDQIYKDILGYKLKLSNLQWMEINILDFKKIKNGDLFSQICLDRSQKTENPILDGSSPSTSQEETIKDRLQEEHTEEEITGGRDGNGSTIQHSGSPATEDTRSAEGDPLSGGTSGKKSLGENTREGIPSHPRGRTEQDSSGSVLQRSKLTEVEPEQENTITDNVVLFIHKTLRTFYKDDIDFAIAKGEVKVAFKKDKYKWDRVNQDLYKYRKTLSNLPLNVIHHLDFMKITNGDPYSQIDFHHTNKTPNPILSPFFTNPSAKGPFTSRTSEGGNPSHQHLEANNNNDELD